jgi:hypothetical protein
MQIITALRFYLMLVDGYHQQHKQQQMLVRIRRKMNLHTLMGESKLVQSLWKTVWRFL